MLRRAVLEAKATYLAELMNTWGKEPADEAHSWNADYVFVVGVKAAAPSVHWTQATWKNRHGLAIRCPAVLGLGLALALDASC
jgi:hypothetical protein